MNAFRSLIAHIYSVAKANTLVYLFHDLGSGVSLVGIADIFPQLRVLNQQYFDIADYVGSYYGQSGLIGARLGSYREH